ncbi:hypothetical protein C8R44DRAFT_613664 [Mycena epipterygia]|nr:hypothetical protein C8R44DRAFT_613664 [Mycena epipterygia]
MHATVHICVVGAGVSNLHHSLLELSHESRQLIGLRHTQHCLDEPLVTLSGIIEPTSTGKVLAETHGVPYFASVDELLAARAAGRVAVDGAILATPNPTHVPLAIQLMHAGVDVLVEKPMSTDIETGRRLVAAAAETRSKILVGHHRRFNPHIVAAKRLLDAGTLGRVLAVQGLWTTLKPPAYFEPPTAWRGEAKTGGVILINLVHDLDLMRYLLGDVVRVYCEKGASTRGTSVEETGALTMVFASGAVGTFVFSDAVVSPHNFEAATGENPMIPYKGENVYTFLGTKGTASFPELKVHRYKPGGAWTDKFVTEPSPDVDAVPPFTRQLQHFARVCRGQEEPDCSELEALKTIILVEAVKESMETGKAVKVPQA